MGRLAALITRRWVAGILALFAVLGAGALIGVVGRADQHPGGTTTLPVGSDIRAAAELRAELPQTQGSVAVVLFASDARLTADQLALVEARARTLPGATGAPASIATDGTAATVLVPVSATDATATATSSGTCGCREGWRARRVDRPGHRSCSRPGRPRRRVRRR